MLRHAGAALIGLLAVLSAAGAAVVVAAAQPWTFGRLVLASAIALLSLYQPRWVLVTLAAVPWLFGNRPSTPQYQWLIWGTSLAALGLLARLVTQSRAEVLAVLRSRIGLAALAYAGASALSLVSLPIDEMAGSALDAGAWETAVTFATADVLDPLYSVRTGDPAAERPRRGGGRRGRTAP